MLEGKRVLPEGQRARVPRGYDWGTDLPYFDKFNDRYAYVLEGAFYFPEVDTLEIKTNLRHFFELLPDRGIEATLGSLKGGSFGVIILDRAEQRILIATDRYGTTPVLYRTDDPDLLLEANFYLDEWTDRDPDPIAVREFLEYGCLLFSDSFVTEVKRTKPAEHIAIEANGSISTGLWYEWRPPEETLPFDASAELLHSAFDGLYSKVPAGAGAVQGLSGGFDSRMILAYLKRHGADPIHCVTMGSHRSEETRYAKKVADLLQVRHGIHPVPEDLPSAFGYKIPASFHLCASFEMSHVFFLQELIGKCMEENPSAYYFDGLLGDGVLAGVYFADLSTRPLGAAIDILGKKFENPLRSFDEYVEISQSPSQRGNDSYLESKLLPGSYRDELMRRSRLQIEGIYPKARSHEEMLHQSRLTQRGYRYTSNGPRSVRRHAPVYLPYLDYEVRDAIDTIPLHETARHYFYRRFLQRYFPEVARIRKAYNNASGFSSTFSFRLHHYMSGVGRRVIYPKIYTWTRGLIDLKPEYSHVLNYLQNEPNQRWFAEELHERQPMLDELDLDPEQLAPISLLRFLALSHFYRIRP